MSKRYDIDRDSQGRLRAQVTEDFAVGLKLLAEDHILRIEQGVHAYGVVDVEFSLGTWRTRKIHIVRDGRDEKFFISYRQFPASASRGEEWSGNLDISGPWDRETRVRVEEVILAVFSQIKSDSAKGILGRPQLRERRSSRRSPSTFGNTPEIADKLKGTEDEGNDDEEAGAEE